MLCSRRKPEGQKNPPGGGLCKDTRNKIEVEITGQSVQVHTIQCFHSYMTSINCANEYSEVKYTVTSQVV